MSCSSRAALLPGSSAVEKLDDAPGGGYQVTVHDPEGFPTNLLHGQDDSVADGELEGSKSPFTSKLLYNQAKDKARWGAYQRFTKGPAAVYRVCFYTLNTSILNINFQWADIFLCWGNS